MRSSRRTAILLMAKTGANLSKCNGENRSRNWSVDLDIDEHESPIDPWYYPKTLRKGSSDLVLYDQRKEARVMVMYTGGTIGMKKRDGVYVPEPNVLPKAVKDYPDLHDPVYAGQCFQDPSQQPLVLPDVREGKRVIYTIYEYEPILDSCNMTIDDWIRIAKDIQKFYKHYDGFVVLHGTDTMAYTASALSFMLENLGKPVIITGSQIPLFEARSDGRDNFLGALILAGNFIIPEVTLYFNHKLFRGNRCTKIDNSSYEAFNSPNMPPLATVQIIINVEWDSVFRSSSPHKFCTWPTLNKNVGILRLFPSMTVETIRAFLAPPIQGVVLQTYGSGNAPDSRHDLLDELKKAYERGVIIINCTQCARGSVSMSYATGKALLDVGVIPGHDMTLEAALAKLSYILSKDSWTEEIKRKMVSENLRGELTQVFDKSISLRDFDLIDAVAKVLHLSTAEEIQKLREQLYPSLLCSAARTGDLEEMEKLCKRAMNLSLVDYDGRTPLHIAVSEGNLDMVEFLLNQGASVYITDAFEKSPLLDAIKFNHYDIIHCLRQAGAHVTLSPIKIGTKLCSAASSNDIDHLRSWFLAGVNLSQGDYSNTTALHVAVRYGFKDCIAFLLQCKADIHAKDMHGGTPMTEALKNQNEVIINMLK